VCHILQAGMHKFSCRQECIVPAGAFMHSCLRECEPLPAVNTCACRGAPPVPCPHSCAAHSCAAERGACTCSKGAAASCRAAAACSFGSICCLLPFARNLVAGQRRHQMCVWVGARANGLRSSARGGGRCAIEVHHAAHVRSGAGKGPVEEPPPSLNLCSSRPGRQIHAAGRSLRGIRALSDAS